MKAKLKQPTFTEAELLDGLNEYTAHADEFVDNYLATESTDQPRKTSL